MTELCEKLLIQKFTDNDFLFLEEYCTVMKPLAETLNFLQGDQNTYYGYLLPSIVSMHTKLEKIRSAGSIKILSKPLDYMLESVQRRFSGLFTLKSKQAVIAAVTNPRFKMRWFNATKDANIDVSVKDIYSWVSASALAFKDLSEPALFVSMALLENIEDNFFDFKDDTGINFGAGFATQTQITQETFQNQFEYELIKFLNDIRTNLNMLED